MSDTEPEVPISQLKDASERRNDALIDSLKKRREDLSNQEVYINIPGYDGEPPILKAKYRLMDGPEIDKLGEKIRRETQDTWTRQLLGAVDTMISCCEGFYVDIGEGNDNLQPLTFEGNPIMGYSEDLAKALAFEAESARQVVFGLFVNNEIAIMQHNMKLNLWMSNTSRKVDEDFLGIV